MRPKTEKRRGIKKEEINVEMVRWINAELTIWTKDGKKGATDDTMDDENTRAVMILYNIFDNNTAKPRNPLSPLRKTPKAAKTQKQERKGKYTSQNGDASRIIFTSWLTG